MKYRDVERRLRALETETPALIDGSVFTVDLNDADAYLIDGIAVDRDEFARRMPPAGPFVVDIGEPDDAPIL